MYFIAAAIYMVAAGCFAIAYSIGKNNGWGFCSCVMTVLSIWILIGGHLGFIGG